MKEAWLWNSVDAARVRCALCEHRCLIEEGRRGICGVRKNQDGKLYTLVYGRLGAMAVDPIEKKPLYHFLPGSHTLSIATRGCNFRCLHCQNCELSQPPEDEPFTRERLVDPAELVTTARASGCHSVAYTYTEPTVFLEYACDIARLAHNKGLKNVLVTNGYATPEALAVIRPHLDAANIDLKSFSDETYRTLCGARLEPVLNTIRLCRRLGLWIEVTTLIIPGWNDSNREMQAIAEFLAAVGREVPWHVTGFVPAYKLTKALPTPMETLERARNIGRKAGLKYVYIGNAPDGAGMSDTMCPSCGGVAIGRSGKARNGEIPHGVCPHCGSPVEGVWS